jgi:predicted O-linked N-acetylglucosamine transferase (SPINDLY family)
MKNRDVARADRLQKILDDASQAFADGRTRRAIFLAKSVCDEAPDQPAAFAAWGHFALAGADYAGARAAYAKAVELVPGNAEFLGSLGFAEAMLGDAGAAVAHLRAAVAIAPHDKRLWVNLGNAVAMASGGTDPARAEFARALALDPADLAARMSFANALSDAGDVQGAVEQLEAATRDHPDDPGARLALAGARDSQLRGADASAVLADDPRPVVWQARLWRSNYDETLSPAQILSLHRAWGAALPPPQRIERRIVANAHKKLRVALLSCDFRDHPVAAFVAPLLAGVDPQSLRITLYNDAPGQDPAQRALRALAGPGGWRDVFGRDAAGLAKDLRDDKIDVLIDLHGHTLGNRMADLALRVAPWQGTWLGYPNTTGVPAIDFRLVDAITDPAPDFDAFASERLVRLDGCFVCYAPPADAPVPAMRPRDAGPVFGSANNFHKAGPSTIALWAQLLHAVPGAALALKSSRLFDNPDARRAVEKMFAAHAVAPERLILHGRAASAGGHLAFYDGIDVALDPLNYNGTTTTCEALWMGVPVVTLAGDRHAARVGASLLTAAGMPDLIAADKGDYVAKAAALIADRDALAYRRSTQRAHLSASRLLDAKAYAAAWEQAVRRAIAGESDA